MSFAGDIGKNVQSLMRVKITFHSNGVIPLKIDSLSSFPE
jgi:hypothetical protein